MATDWLRYANQSATRRLPLDDRLVQALSFLPELGVSMEVFSGGQPGKGSGLARIGSTRHDHGNAADAFFYKDGRRLDWADPKDRSIFEDIVRRAKSAGVTGLGAGPGYMQPGSMHIGFGTPGVWGAGGSSKNAPDWLQQAFGGVSAGGVSTPTMADAKAGTFDPVGEVMASASQSGNQAIGGRQSVFGGVPAIATSDQIVPAEVKAAANPSTSFGGKPADLFGMMALANSQQPQFSPVQIAGPSADQSTGLLQLVQALKSRIA